MTKVSTTNATTMSKQLLVFDYDFSLVNEDSDVFIFDQLCPELHAFLKKLHHVEGVQWTQAVNQSLQALHERMRSQTEDLSSLIRSTLARIPVQESMLQAVKFAVEKGNCDFYIVSDANTVYIQSMLDHHGMNAYVTKVFTNVGIFQEDGRLQVLPYQRRHEPHGCTWCPINMCKGCIIDQIRKEKEYARVFYVGDGSGDFCPGARLTSKDFLFARRDADKEYALTKRIGENPNMIQAAIHEWSTGHDIFQYFQKFMISPTDTKNVEAPSLEATAKDPRTTQ